MPQSLRLSTALLAGSALLAAFDVVAIVLAIPMPSSGAGTRAAHLVFDGAETLGVGALAAVAVALVGRFVGRPPWATLLLAGIATMLVAHLAVGGNIARAVQFTVSGQPARALYVAYLVGLGYLVPQAYLLAARLALGPRARVVLLALAVGVLVGDQLPARDDYHGLHGLIACGAALLGGTAAAPVVEPWLRRLAEPTRGRLALGLVGLVAIGGLLVPPGNAVRFELFRPPCAVAPWVLAAIWRAPRLHGPAPSPAPSPWNHDRSRDPPVPPTTPRPMPDDAVVVLVTIDATRADVVADPANRALLPTLAALEHQGVVFTRASAAGSQTPLSLAALFSGRTFSEQLWAEHGEGRARYLFPADDPSIRFPAVLSEHGVSTVDVAGVNFLVNEYGVLRGFGEQVVVAQGTAHARGADVVDRLLERLRRATGPTLLYTHLMEPHEPYDRGRKDGTDYERYLSEIAVADAQIARILHVLEQRFPLRWALFVSADHGEAFGEHGTREHAKSLYQELVHVPLIAASPLFAPRTVDERVGLVDLGPTILDLFGLDTPPTFLGQSLVPFLVGGTAHLTRPIFAEGRLRRSLTTPDGLEVIEDLRRKTAEVYDLPSDPGETRNLFDVDPGRSDVALAALRAFFAAHTRTENGYDPPYEP